MQPAAVQQTTRPVPTYIRYFKHPKEVQEQVPGSATVTGLESSSETKEQAMMNEIAKLKAQLSAQSRPLPVERQSQTPGSAVEDRISTGLVGSEHAMVNTNTKVKEKTSQRTQESPRESTSEKGEDKATSEQKTHPKGFKAMARTRKALSQLNVS
jgi:hypothetical protein